MAFSSVAGRGITGERVSGNSITRAIANGNVTVGEILFAALLTDNLQTTGGSSSNHTTMTDTKGNTWTKLFEETDTDGAAADGITYSLWFSKVTTQLVEITDSVTAGTSAAVTSKAFALFRVLVAAGKTIALENVAYGHSAATATLSSLTSREYLFLGIHCGENETITIGEDADYTEIHIEARSETTGGEQTNVTLHQGSRIATLTGDTYTVGGTGTGNLLTILAAIKEVDPGGGTQTLDGALFTKAPTFSTGAITTSYALAGAEFTKAPTFSTGAITSNYNLTGAEFLKAPTFFQGVVTPGAVTLNGVLFTQAPTFFAGDISTSGGLQTLDGALFTSTPSFPQGTVTSTYALAGAEFTNTPVFPQGAVTASFQIDGVLFTSAPTFPQGAVTTSFELLGAEFTKAPTFFTGTLTVGAVTLDGVLFTNAPLFNAGVLTQEGGPQPLGGTLFQSTPTFPQGAITTGAVSLDGVLFTSAPSFPTGTVSATFTLNGVEFTSTPVFPQGAILADQVLAGAEFLNSPVFFIGTVGVQGSLDGVLFQNSPSFFVGTLTQSGGSFWRPNPVAYTLNPAAYDPVLRNEVPPWPIEVHGSVFTKAPTFPVGVIS